MSQLLRVLMLQGSVQLDNYAFIHTGGQTDEHKEGCAVLTLLTSESRHHVMQPRQPYMSSVRMRHFQFESRNTAPHTVCCTGRWRAQDYLEKNLA